MTTLVLGATGATGKHLVAQLLARGERVRAVVRSRERVPAELREDERLELIEGTVLEMDDATLDAAVRGCGAVASCLGHNLTRRGIYGHPRRLVTDSVRRVCASLRRVRPSEKVRFVLMNTTGNRNRDLDEPQTLFGRVMLMLLRIFLPPHPDNEQAADYLRVEVGPRDELIEWVAVRPDTLIDEDAPSPWSVHPSPTRDPLLNAGKTSRVNVGAFMASLVTEDELWATWKGRMPVLYNADQAATANAA